MIGKIYLAVVNFYDNKTNTTRLKGRPVLVISELRNNDYTALPISTIKNRDNLDYKYDLLVEPKTRELLGLSQECFVRAHKQMAVHRVSLLKLKGDLRQINSDFYLEVLSKMEQYQQELLNNAL